MGETLNRSWALLLGMLLLMIGNGIQGTLLSVRGAIEGFNTLEMSLVMSAYFVGFLGGSRFAPNLIARVGHVRVFAALGSLVSAALILFPTVTDPVAWIALRVLVGFCFSGVYVTAESWLNDATSNANRGKALSLYMVVQTLGIITAQGLVAIGDPSGFVLFIVPSVLVSLAFAPILLSVSPAPPFGTIKIMSLGTLFRFSPLTCMAIFLLGAVYSALFGMAGVFGVAAGLSVTQISILTAAIFAGGLVMQFPVGAISDRMDRRQLILIVAAAGIGGALLGAWSQGFAMIVVAALIIGGAVNPLYGLVIAYANDYLEPEDMAGAAGQIVFLNGVGAVGGPVVTASLMTIFGPAGFFVFIAWVLSTLLVYGIYRSFRRPTTGGEEGVGYVPVSLASSGVVVGAAQTFAAESGEEDDVLADREAEDEDEDLEDLPAA